MKIVGAHWTPQVNWIEIRCGCGVYFDHRADRWRVTCPECGSGANLGTLRDAYSMRDPAVRRRQIEMRHPST